MDCGPRKFIHTIIDLVIENIMFQIPFISRENRLIYILTKIIINKSFGKTHKGNKKRVALVSPHPPSRRTTSSAWEASDRSRKLLRWLEVPMRISNSTYPIPLKK